MTQTHDGLLALLPAESDVGSSKSGKQVIDARDPMGTRSPQLEQHLRRNARHKQLLLLLNKCDLVVV